MKIFKQEEGASLVLVGIAFMGIMMMAGLVLDGGALFMEKRNLQKAANAAVLSSAQELTTDQASVQEIVNEVLQKHGEITSLENTQIQVDNRVDVYLTKNVTLSFGRLFGKDTTEVKVHAAAELTSMGKAAGAAPLGIDDRVELNYYSEYKLKVDQKENEYGYFGVLALGGPGAATYEDNLRNGYEDQIEVGMVLDTETGNVAGKTRSVVSEKLLDSCGYEAASKQIDRDCDRILLVPVYTPHKQSTNQLKSVEVTGFAYFFITEPIDPKDTSITGMFVKRAGKGVYESGAYDRGAYAIRLTR